jgi:8-oxo-dGTP pyrophosphatase MutT (NUDIX family)
MTEFNVLAVRRQNGDLEFIGAAEAASAHRYGMPHTTVLLVPVVQMDDGKNRLILHQRSPNKRTSPGKLDFNGGHITFSEQYFVGTPWESAYDLENATLDAACREANEEIRLSTPFNIKPETLLRFRGLGYFDCRTETPTGPNVEYSTCYLVAVPSSRDLHIFDTDPAGERELPLSRHPLNEILDTYRRQQDLFADGAGRILSALIRNEELASDFCALIAEAGALSQ